MTPEYNVWEIPAHSGTIRGLLTRRQCCLYSRDVITSPAAKDLQGASRAEYYNRFLFILDVGDSSSPLVTIRIDART